MTHIDEYGTWEINEYGVKMLIEPSQKWYDEQPEPEPEPTETPKSTIEVLQEQNKQLEAKVKALSESSQMLEDCIVEMAEIVYA